MNPHPIIAALRDERLARGITQQQLAERTGWAKRTIASAETGSTSPTLAFTDDYAAALGLSLAALKDGQTRPAGRRAEQRRRCVCGGTYQVTRHNQIRKHQCGQPNPAPIEPEAEPLKAAGARIEDWNPCATCDCRGTCWARCCPAHLDVGADCRPNRLCCPVCPEQFHPEHPPGIDCNQKASE